jgi:RNA polymerase sigma factor (sigma-70 family)
LEIDDALIKQWEPKITRMTSTYNIRGLHKDDLAQELRICILKAAKRFDPERQVTFHTYLHTTMVNTIRTLATKSQRNLNNNASYLGEVFTGNDLNDDSPSSNLSKEVFLEDKKDWLDIVEVQDLLYSLKLTKPELAFLALRQAGHSIKEIHLKFEKAFPENSLALVREHVKQKFLRHDPA